MNALDTNILVRLFIANKHIPEDYAQHLTIKNLLENPPSKQGFFISLTVILETVWVLQSRYKQPKEIIVHLFATLAKMTCIHIEQKPQLEQALSYYLNGMDFADALHLVQSNHCQHFYTFDQKLIKKALSFHSTSQVTIPQAINQDH